MSAESVASIMTDRLTQLKQKSDGLLDNAKIYEPKEQKIIIKPAAKSWEELKAFLEDKKLVDFDGHWKTIRDLFDQGYSAELETAAEIALAVANKPSNFFATSTSKKSGNWATKTLQKVHETWEVRRNSFEVIERLNLKTDSVKAIFALAWRLKASILRFLGIATEKGTGIRNPAGIFFALTKPVKT